MRFIPQIWGKQHLKIEIITMMINHGDYKIIKEVKYITVYITCINYEEDIKMKL